MHPDIQAWIDAEIALEQALERCDELLVIAMRAELPLRLRKARPGDIQVGNIIWYVNAGDDPFWALVSEVHSPSDHWKAFTSHDGCRYGLDDAQVEE